MSDYFGQDSSGRAPGAAGRYVAIDDQPEVEAAPGVRIRAVAGGALMLSYVRLDPRSEAATHTHDEEQMGIVLSGRCTFSLDGDVRELHTGDVYHAPPGVPHGAATGDEPCEILDLFAPPRAALLELIEKSTS
ncbi:MAG: cupin domain-containing protein [Actinomycetota bacterium]